MSKLLTLKMFWTTLRHALLLNTHFYENVQSTSANRSIALTIVLLASLSHVLGSAVILLISRIPIPILVTALVVDGLSIILGYYFWTFWVFKIGKRLRPTDLTYKNLLNLVGFAYAPQALNFLTLIPLLGRVIEFMLSIWSLLAVIVAVRQGLNLRTRTATIVCLISWIPIQFLISLVITFFTSIIDTAQ